MQFCDKTAYVQVSSLSMRSFAIEDPGSPVPPLYATLVYHSPEAGAGSSKEVDKPHWTRPEKNCSIQFLLVYLVPLTKNIPSPNIIQCI